MATDMTAFSCVQPPAHPITEETRARERGEVRGALIRQDWKLDCLA